MDTIFRKGKTPVVSRKSGRPGYEKGKTGQTRGLLLLRVL
jgi:hypothetical protein